MKHTRPVLKRNVRPNRAIVAVLLSAVAIAACKSRSYNATAKNDVQAPQELFKAEDTLKFKLEAPFSGLDFNGASSRGVLSLASGASIPVDVSVRGNTSVSACTFPKLQIQIGEGADGAAAKLAASRTVFERTGSFNIGTHCDMGVGGDPLSKAGRLGTEQSVYRELTVYRMINAYLGEESHRVRPAEITYVDPTNGKSFTRQALLVERKKPFAKRIGAEEVEASAVWLDDLEAPQFARTAFAYLLSGSLDYFFLMQARYEWSTPPARPTDAPKSAHWWWNAYPVKDKATGKAKIIPYDFDVGILINPKLAPHRYANPEFLGGEPRLFRNAVALVQLEKQRHPPAAFDKAVADLKGARDRIDAAIAASPVDDEGRSQAKAWHAAVQRAIEPEWLDLRTVAKSGTLVFLDKDLTRKACADGLTAGEPLIVYEEKSGLARIRTVFHFRESQGCDGVDLSKDDAWISSTALVGQKTLTPTRRPASEDAKPVVVYPLYADKATAIKNRQGDLASLSDSEKCTIARAVQIQGTTTHQGHIQDNKEIPFTLTKDVPGCGFAKQGVTIWIWGSHWGVIGG